MNPKAIVLGLFTIITIAGAVVIAAFIWYIADRYSAAELKQYAPSVKEARPEHIENWMIAAYADSKILLAIIGIGVISACFIGGLIVGKIAKQQVFLNSIVVCVVYFLTTLGTYHYYPLWFVVSVSCGIIFAILVGGRLGRERAPSGSRMIQPTPFSGFGKFSR
jgi:hypothetical protein